MSGSKETTQRMAEILRSGGKMLNYNCPECSSPLFQLKSGEIWCAKCQRPVVIVPETTKTSYDDIDVLWKDTEQTLIEKVFLLNKLLSVEVDLVKIKELSEVLSSLLSSIEVLRRVKRR